MPSFPITVSRLLWHESDNFSTELQDRHTKVGYMRVSACPSVILQTHCSLRQDSRIMISHAVSQLDDVMKHHICETVSILQLVLCTTC